MSDSPKVTVGIPTYNRPDGVLRTLKQITAQTYANLEIVISNNASTNELVAPLLDRCAAADPRIKVVHQKENLGIPRNFKYVLQAATSDYFMWAADDDEWDISYISTCMEHMLTHDVGTVMPGFYRHNRALDRKGMAHLPKMEGVDRFADVMAFYEAMPHSIFYGLHRRETILWFVDEDPLLNDDEYFLVRQMLMHGILTLPEKILYCAGIEDATYQVKVPREAGDRYVYQYNRLLNLGRLVAESTVLNDLQKLMVLQKAVLAKLTFVLAFEKGMRDDTQYQVAQALYEFISQVDVRHLGAYARVLSGIHGLLQRTAGGGSS